MKLSREKILRLSHVVMQQLNADDGVEFFDDLPEIRQQVVFIISNEIKADEALDAIVRRKIESQKRVIVEGSDEWDVLYRKYYEEEAARHRKLVS